METGIEGFYTEERRHYQEDMISEVKYWRGMMEDKVTKRKQQGILVSNPDIMNPSKPLIPYKYSNMMELKKLNRKN